MPLSEKRQTALSGCPGARETPASRSQSFRYSARASADSPPMMSLIHLLLARAEAKEIPKSRMNVERIGTRSCTYLPPGSQFSDQNLAREPSPRRMTMEALQMATAAASSLTGIKDQGGGIGLHRSQGQRLRRAVPKRRRFRTPRPPISRGWQTTRDHGSRQWPPFISSPLAKLMKLLQPRLMMLSAHRGSGITDKR